MKMTIKMDFLFPILRLRANCAWSAEFCPWTGDSHSIFREDLRIGEIPKLKPFKPKFQEKRSREEKAKKRVIENHNGQYQGKKKKGKSEPVVDVCYSRALATENFISNENRAIKKSMTPGGVLTKSKV